MDGLGAEPDEEIRRYWEERNRVRFARIAATPPSPEKLALLAEVERRRSSYRIALGRCHSSVTRHTCRG